MPEKRKQTARSIHTSPATYDRIKEHAARAGVPMRRVIEMITADIAPDAPAQRTQR